MNHPSAKTRRHDKQLTEAHTSPTKTRTIIGIGVVLELPAAALAGYFLTTNPLPFPQLAAVVLFLALSILGERLQHRPHSPRPTTETELDHPKQFVYDMGFLLFTAGASAILSVSDDPRWWPVGGPLALGAIAVLAAICRTCAPETPLSAQDLRALAAQHREEARRLEARADELDPPQTSTP